MNNTGVNKIWISVVMPNYNTSIEMLNEAVNSILNQSYQKFEFIIMDDCSTNGSYEWLGNIEDPRIRLFRNDRNMGITKTLNRGFDFARGKYIARMDSDDIALPTRFENQLRYMEENPNVIVCGTSVQYFGDESQIDVRVMPKQEIHKCSFLFGNRYGLYHPTAFFRRSMLMENQIVYDEDLPTAQDYGMWTTCVRYGEIGWIPDVLLNYRVHSGQVSIAKREIQKFCTLLVQRKQLAQLLGREVTEWEAQRHKMACSLKDITKEDIKWFHFLLEENRKSEYLPINYLDEYVNEFINLKVHNVTKVGKSPKKLIEMLRFLPWKNKITVFSTMVRRLFRRVQLIVTGK